VNADWFYSEGDERRGPVTEEELKRLATDGKLQKTDLVWKDGMKDWVEARTVDILFPRRAEQSRDADRDGQAVRRRFDPEDERPSRARRAADLEEDDRPSRRGRRRDEEDDDDRPRVRRAYDEDDYDDRPRRRAPEKPGQIQAVAIMMLVGGILGLIAMLSYLAATFCFILVWPGFYFEFVVSILLIIRGINMLNKDDQGPPRTLAILQIICIVNLDVINCVLGIIAIVMLNAPEVVSYYRKKGFDS
jgi:GYF domain 2